MTQLANAEANKGNADAAQPNHEASIQLFQFDRLDNFVGGLSALVVQGVPTSEKAICVTFREDAQNTLVDCFENRSVEPTSERKAERQQLARTSSAAVVISLQLVTRLKRRVSTRRAHGSGICGGHVSPRIFRVGDCPIK